MSIKIISRVQDSTGENVFFYTRPPPQNDFVPDLHYRFAQCRSGTVIKRNAHDDKKNIDTQGHDYNSLHSFFWTAKRKNQRKALRQ